MAFPCEAVDLFYMEIYGGFGYDWSAACGTYLSLATGQTQGGNPPYTVSDFLAFYPQFCGPSQSVPGTVTEGSSVITGVSPAYGIQPGQLLGGPFPGGTVVSTVSSGSVTVTNPASASASAFAVYSVAPPVPLIVMQAYINLANASLMSSRWRELWTIAMGWYIAHFLTLYLQSMGDGTTAAGQIAAMGLEQSLITSRTAGAVSYSTDNPLGTGLQSWGAWTKTAFGTALISHAQVVGAGAVYIR